MESVGRFVNGFFRRRSLRGNRGLTRGTGTLRRSRCRAPGAPGEVTRRARGAQGHGGILAACVPFARGVQHLEPFWIVPRAGMGTRPVQVRQGIAAVQHGAPLKFVRRRKSVMHPWLSARTVVSRRSGGFTVENGRRTVCRSLAMSLAAPPMYAGRERGPVGPVRWTPTRLLDVVRERLRLRRYSARTCDTYVAWIRLYVRFGDCRLRSGAVRCSGGPGVSVHADQLGERECLDAKSGARRAQVPVCSGAGGACGAGGRTAARAAAGAIAIGVDTRRGTGGAGTDAPCVRIVVASPLG